MRRYDNFKHSFIPLLEYILPLDTLLHLFLFLFLFLFPQKADAESVVVSKSILIFIVVDPKRGSFYAVV